MGHSEVFGDHKYTQLLREGRTRSPVKYSKVRCPDFSCFKKYIVNSTLLIIPGEGLIYPDLDEGKDYDSCLCHSIRPGVIECLIKNNIISVLIYIF